MIADELVSFELAVLVKEAGFIKSKGWMGFVDKFYHPRTGTLLSMGRTGRTPFNTLIYAPTLTSLQRWFREKHNIDVLPTMSRNSRTYGFRIFCIENGKTVIYNHIYEKYETYELTLEVGLIEACKSLK